MNLSHITRFLFIYLFILNLFCEILLPFFSVFLKIIENEINPFVNEWEEKGMFPAHTVFKKLGDAGLLGITRPTEYGGLGLDYNFSMTFFEELAKINCGGIPMAIVVHTDCATPALSCFGSDKLKKEFLVPSISGDRVSCIGISEPNHGSDVAAIETTAVRRNDDLIINGGKMWTTNGCQADWMCLLANTNQGPSHKNKSLICLPLNLPGVHISKPLKKMGMKSSDTAQIYFEDVKVPAEYLIGEEGKGFFYQMVQFQDERLAGIALSCAQMTRMVSDTIEYCQMRKAFGKKIIDNQIIHYRLAELQTEIEALRSLLMRITDDKNNGKDITYLASMGKLKAGRLSREVMDSCLQYWGGMGYTDDVLISRFYRDARLLSIGAGTDEIMLSIICKYMKIFPK
ncbi:probable acyl-CoA dehydrogenase 6 [Uloborus diversus]|uniref:probable acyl-CoA dehydrogenase 6 n=1 Tax=Uloborus diversus TaxID=327109 RepID=UPI00240A524C|nr:probable acyl-CoA dehydrogenase 6 [Uloborus diversus]